MSILGYNIGIDKIGQLDSRIIEETRDVNELVVTSIANADLDDPVKDHDTANQIGNYGNEVIIT